MFVGRVLAALVTMVLALAPVGLEGRRAVDGGRGRPGTEVSSATGRFTLVRGVIGGSVTGLVDRAFVGTGAAICFLPGTFDVSVDGIAPGDLQPSSHCGYDALVRVEGLADIKAGDEAARPMLVSWTDLAGRSYTLRFEALEAAGADDVRVICLGAAVDGCHSAVVDSSPFTLLSQDGVAHGTGSRAHLSVSVGPDEADSRDLGVYDVPFTLTIDGL